VNEAKPMFGHEAMDKKPEIKARSITAQMGRALRGVETNGVVMQPPEVKSSASIAHLLSRFFWFFWAFALSLTKTVQFLYHLAHIFGGFHGIPFES
jgi:hypothetical protein